MKLKRVGSNDKEEEVATIGAPIVAKKRQTSKEKEKYGAPAVEDDILNLFFPNSPKLAMAALGGCVILSSLIGLWAMGVFTSPSHVVPSPAPRNQVNQINPSPTASKLPQSSGLQSPSPAQRQDPAEKSTGRAIGKSGMSDGADRESSLTQVESDDQRDEANSESSSTQVKSDDDKDEIRSGRANEDNADAGDQSTGLVQSSGKTEEAGDGKDDADREEKSDKPSETVGEAEDGGASAEDATGESKVVGDRTEDDSGKNDNDEAEEGKLKSAGAKKDDARESVEEDSTNGDNSGTDEVEANAKDDASHGANSGKPSESEGEDADGEARDHAAGKSKTVGKRSEENSGKMSDGKTKEENDKDEDNRENTEVEDTVKDGAGYKDKSSKPSQTKNDVVNTETSSKDAAGKSNTMGKMSEDYSGQGDGKSETVAEGEVVGKDTDGEIDGTEPKAPAEFGGKSKKRFGSDDRSENNDERENNGDAEGESKALAQSKEKESASDASVDSSNLVEPNEKNQAMEEKSGGAVGQSKASIDIADKKGRGVKEIQTKDPVKPDSDNEMEQAKPEQQTIADADKTDDNQSENHAEHKTDKPVQSEGNGGTEQRSGSEAAKTSGVPGILSTSQKASSDKSEFLGKAQAREEVNSDTHAAQTNPAAGNTVLT